MGTVFTAGWRDDLVAAANDDDQFATATERFDGSVTLHTGEEMTWLKVYRGEIIDREQYVPAFGTTFAIAGDAEAWRALAAGETSLSESLYDGSLRVQGNRIEANRMREMTELLCRHLQAVTEVEQ